MNNNQFNYVPFNQQFQPPCTFGAGAQATQQEGAQPVVADQPATIKVQMPKMNLQENVPSVTKAKSTVYTKQKGEKDISPAAV